MSCSPDTVLPFILGFAAAAVLFLPVLALLHKRESARLKALTDYLEKVNSGCTDILFPVRDDDYSRLQDEIYRTVTELYHTREAARSARSLYAENLDNIAHQLKTPVTSLSLSLQMLRGSMPPQPSAQKMSMQQMPEQRCFSEYLDQIARQLARLTHLEEALLLLSRVDSGTLPLEKKPVDVFTLLSLAADNLAELFSAADVTVRILQEEEMLIQADLEWTMEAVINLLKNCMEHTPAGGSVCCSYEQNPIYTQICIWDTGPGFDREDLPHLFERFYRGKNAQSGGIGIGLSLSRAIIESQNGTIAARNLPTGGALFEIHFYSH